MFNNRIYLHDNIILTRIPFFRIKSKYTRFDLKKMRSVFYAQFFFLLVSIICENKTVHDLTYQLNCS